MKFKRLIVLCSLLCVLFVSFGAAAANENITMSDSIDMQDNLMDGSDDYNAEIRIHNIDFKDECADVYVNVYNNRQEPVTDAKLYMNGNHTADIIDDENKDYHFYIYTNGGYNLTLDDGFYKASPLFFKISTLHEVTHNDDAPSKIKLVSKNVTMYYDDVTAEITVYALDEKGRHISGLNVLMNGDYYPDYDDNDGYQFLIDYLPVGTHKFQISLDEEEYVADPIDVQVKILKSTPTLTAKKWYSTKGQYVTLRAEVEDEYQSGWIDEGTVTFKINGKSYTVKVNGGDAVKKVKISKTGTYTYTATFKSSNHYTKTVKSKIYVYSTSKKARTFSIGKYKVTLSLNQFKKLVNAKNTNKLVAFEVKTNKYFTQNVGSYKTIIKWKYMGKMTPEWAHQKGYKIKNYVKHWISDGEYYYTCDGYKKVSINKMVYKTVSGKVSIIFSYGGKAGGQYAFPNKYCITLTTPYQNPGWDYCKPWLCGAKKSTEINNLNSAKTTKW
ncbi:Ig-like domain-containing protein [Methanobrevibacter sp.]|uniref:Ig-like domain-containing protein n=1 Tax=Methanobrevibacter sp. TaxID=66852 RepID=UPI0025E03060|nr:Ig-like domain-containing protein [Methanobrevibacter sp.]